MNCTDVVQWWISWPRAHFPRHRNKQLNGIRFRVIAELNVRQQKSSGCGRGRERKHIYTIQIPTNDLNLVDGLFYSVLLLSLALLLKRLMIMLLLLMLCTHPHCQALSNTFVSGIIVKKSANSQIKMSKLVWFVTSFS